MGRPFNPRDPNDLAAAEFNTLVEEQSPLIARALPPAPGAVRYEPRDERAAYWQRDPTVDEQAIWTGALGKLILHGATYESAVQVAEPWVAMAVYPARNVLNPQTCIVTAGERGLSIEKQREFCDRMERMGPPEGDDDDGGLA